MPDPAPMQQGQTWTIFRASPSSLIYLCTCKKVQLPFGC